MNSIFGCNNCTWVLLLVIVFLLAQNGEIGGFYGNGDCGRYNNDCCGRYNDDCCGRYNDDCDRSGCGNRGYNGCGCN